MSENTSDVREGDCAGGQSVEKVASLNKVPFIPLDLECVRDGLASALELILHLSARIAALEQKGEK